MLLIRGKGFAVWTMKKGNKVRISRVHAMSPAIACRWVHLCVGRFERLQVQSLGWIGQLPAMLLHVSGDHPPRA